MKTKTDQIKSRIEITNPAIVKRLKKALASHRPETSLFGFVNWLVELGLEAYEKQQKPQPEGER